jgi:hypothetical protein
MPALDRGPVELSAKSNLRRGGAARDVAGQRAPRAPPASAAGLGTTQSSTAKQCITLRVMNAAEFVAHQAPAQTGKHAELVSLGVRRF